MNKRTVSCGICGHAAPSLSSVAEDYVLDLIRKDHPEWVREDGACPECLAYYSTLDAQIEVVVDGKTD